MSQAVIETRSGLVFISGQVDWNHQYETTEQSIEGQMGKALANLAIALENAGSSVDRLLQVRIYVRGEFGEYMNTIAPILTSFLGESHRSRSDRFLLIGVSYRINILESY